MGTDPKNPDTDTDGLTDGQEVNQFGTDPKNQDTDSDNMVDGQEVNVAHTQPKNPDTDGDGTPDGLDPDPLAAPTATVAPPTDTPPPSPTAIVSAFNGEWRATVTTKPANVSFAIAQLVVSNVNPQNNLASIHLCRCNSDACDARVVVSPLQAQAGVDGLKLVTTEPFYISDTRFWILKAIRNGKQLIVTVEERFSDTQNLATVPNDLTLRPATNKERTTAFSCSSSVFVPLNHIILNPGLILLPPAPTPTP